MWNEAYSDGWPMAIAMIAGSLIAGSTPLGGGVVAFPVSVLVLKLSPQEGRDFASLIQSIGMVAAAFLITSCKAHLLHRELIVFSTVAGTWGVSYDTPSCYGSRKIVEATSGMLVTENRDTLYRWDPEISLLAGLD